MSLDEVGLKLLGITKAQFSEDLLPPDLYKLPRGERRKKMGEINLRYAALLEEAEINDSSQRIKKWEKETGFRYSGLPEYRRKEPEKT